MSVRRDGAGIAGETPPPLHQLFDPPPTPIKQPANKPEGVLRSLSIRHVPDELAEAAQTAQEQADAAIPDVRIPAGSILRGVFLSGMPLQRFRAIKEPSL